MGWTDLFKSKEADTLKDIDKIVKDLKDLQLSIIEFTNDSSIDMEISEMIGKLKAQNPENVDPEKLMEFLAYLSDKTKTKSDMTQSHYTDTMMKVIHAKIELLAIYHTGVVRGSVIRQIFSMSSVWPILFSLVFIVAILIGTHKYDPSLFRDLGISGQRTVKTEGTSK